MVLMLFSDKFYRLPKWGWGVDQCGDLFVLICLLGWLIGDFEALGFLHVVSTKFT